MTTNLYDPVEFTLSAIARGERSAKLRTRERNASLARQKLQRLTTIDTSAIAARLHSLDGQNMTLRAQQADRIAADAAFVLKSLPRQCESLGIPLETMTLVHSKDGWIVDGVAYKNPELAVFFAFKAQGYEGMHCEGSAVISLMKCACIDYFSEHAALGEHKLLGSEARKYALTGGFESLCTIHEDNIEGILAIIALAEDSRMRKHIQEFVLAVDGGGVYERATGFYSVMSEAGLWAIWKAMGAANLARFARAYLHEDPWDFRAGWPDLTIVKGGDLRFVEVKTSDKIHESQLDTFRGLLIPVGANLSVVKLVASKA